MAAKKTTSTTRKAKKEEEIVVTVGRMGADAKRVALKGANTVKEALVAMGLNKKGSEIVQVNGEEVSQSGIMDRKLREGDQVILTRNIEGGLI